MAQTVQYDPMGSKEDAYVQTAMLQHAQRDTVWRLVGERTRQRVLDLASGFGFSTRQHQQWGTGRSAAILATAEGTPRGVQSGLVSVYQTGREVGGANHR